MDTQALIHSHYLEVKPNCCSILNISEDIKLDISSFSAPLILSRILPEKPFLGLISSSASPFLDLGRKRAYFLILNDDDQVFE